MEDILNNKIKDYSYYVLRAIDNFNKGHYPDCAVNCRKAGEAACKVIYYHIYNKKRAEDKTAGKLLGELISQIKKDNVAERRAINNLETIQITGNVGAHDSPVTKDEAAYVLDTLNLLTAYLFEENLKIPIPEILNFDAEISKDAKQTEIIEKIIIQDKNDPKKEAEWLEKLATIERKNERLEQHITDKLKELSEIKKEELLVEEPPILSPPPEKSLSRKSKIFYVVSGCLVLILSLTWFYLKSNQEIATPFYQKSDTLFVAINTLQVLQDNPNMNFKIESILKSYIEAKSHLDRLTIKVIPTEFKGIDMNNDTTVTRFAQAHGFQVVYFGTLYETALGDSNILEIKGGLSGGDLAFRTKKIKFKTLADSTFTKEMNDQANTSIYAYCEGRFKGKEIEQGIKILEEAMCYSNENYKALKGRLARFLYLDRNYRASLLIDRSILLRYPNSAYFSDRIAKTYIELGKLDSAEIYAQHAHTTDSIQLTYAFNYAWVLVTRKKYDDARLMLEKIIRKDAKNSPALSLLKFIGRNPNDHFLMGKEMDVVCTQANTLMTRRDYKAALGLFLKANRLDPENISIQLRMAYCFFFTGDTANGYLYVNKVLKKDSLYEDGFVLLAYIDGHSSRGASTASKIYARAIRLWPKDLDLLRNYADYLMRKKRFKQCRDICDQGLINYSSDIGLNTDMAHACLFLQDYRCAKDKFEWLNLFNPNDENRMYLSECYLELSKDCKSPEFTKGFALIQKVIEIDKNNIHAIALYARYISAANNNGNLDPGKLHFRAGAPASKNIMHNP